MSIFVIAEDKALQQYAIGFKDALPVGDFIRADTLAGGRDKFLKAIEENMRMVKRAETRFVVLVADSDNRADARQRIQDSLASLEPSVLEKILIILVGRNAEEAQLAVGGTKKTRQAMGTLLARECLDESWGQAGSLWRRQAFSLNEDLVRKWHDELRRAGRF